MNEISTVRLNMERACIRSFKVEHLNSAQPLLCFSLALPRRPWRGRGAAWQRRPFACPPSRVHRSDRKPPIGSRLPPGPERFRQRRSGMVWDGLGWSGMGWRDVECPRREMAAAGAMDESPEGRALLKSAKENSSPNSSSIRLLFATIRLCQSLGGNERFWIF